jgi:hypothetical protein
MRRSFITISLLIALVTSGYSQDTTQTGAGAQTDTGVQTNVQGTTTDQQSGVQANTGVVQPATVNAPIVDDEDEIAGTWEAGIQFTMMRHSSETGVFTSGGVAGTRDIRRYPLGFGGRIGFNAHRNVAFEAEGNWFPQESSTVGGRMTQFLAGLKVGGRGERAGFFLKARPGFVNFSYDDDSCATGATPGNLCLVKRNHFALDLGAVLELYPSKRSFVRFDLGDTMIRYYRQNNGIFLGGAGTNPGDDGFMTDNIQFSAGVGVRF